jgi:cell division protein FtsW (lipid II flippase)
MMMTMETTRFIYWTPRLAGLVVSAFLAMFALDAFTAGSFAEGRREFARHLIPAIIVAAVVAVAWRYERAGAAAFFLLAAGYAIAARARLDWVAVISGPLVLLGILFLVSARYQRA